MCIHCRGRFYQSDLLRLQCIQHTITTYTGTGRSFYLCGQCIDDKKVLRSVSRVCKISKEHQEALVTVLKEIAENAKSSGS